MHSRKKLTLDGHLTGIVVPVSALRSQIGCGIGEFQDLPAFGAWAKSAGFNLIQLLPVNDTGFDASPYSSVSAFALHPAYVHLEGIPGWEKFSVEIEAFRLGTQHRIRVDFESVLAFKLDVLQRLFDAQGDLDASTNDWIESNPWVKIYAVYKCLKERNDRRGWPDWTSGRDLSLQQIDVLFDELGRATRFHAWTQYHLDRQLVDAADRLESAGVYLKGDVPILMSVDSADVWAHRSYFDLDFRAGAPPDMFATLGQMWGFPIYDWDAMADNDYDWWRRRLIHASRYYHAFRIDHVLGFFRIWSVPAADDTAVLGRYRPAAYLRQHEIEESAGSDYPVHRLTRAWTTAEQAASSLADRADEILERFFERAGNDDHVLQPEFDSDSAIRGSEEDQVVASFLTARRRDRTFLHTDTGDYAPAWFAATSSGYLEADDETRQRIDELSARFQDRSKPLWLEMGRRLLRMVKDASPMLPCAEDLGVVPPGLPGVLEELRILSLKIERWETDEEAGLLDPAAFPYLSVSTPGVHDTSALRGWWEETDWDRVLFCRQLGIEEPPPWLTPEVAQAVLLRSLRSNSAIRVFQIQDLFTLTLDLRTPEPDGERINRPGSVSKMNWSYSLPILVENLPQHDVTDMLRDLIESAARGNSDSQPSVRSS